MRQLPKRESSICGSAFSSVASLAVSTLAQPSAHCSVHPFPHEIEPQPPEIEVNSNDSQTRWVGREPLIAELIQKFQGNCRILSIVGKRTSV